MRDADGRHIVITNPFTQVAEPQFTYRDYEKDDFIELTNPDAILKAGLAVRVDENGVEIVTSKPFTIGDNKETKSGRVFYQSFCKKYNNDVEKINKALELEEQLALEKIAQYALLKVSTKIDGAGRRQYFQDHETPSFLSGFFESIRVEVGSLIDDKISELERRIPRNIEDM